MDSYNLLLNGKKKEGKDNLAEKLEIIGGKKDEFGRNSFQSRRDESERSSALERWRSCRDEKRGRRCRTRKKKGEGSSWDEANQMHEKETRTRGVRDIQAKGFMQKIMQRGSLTNITSQSFILQYLWSAANLHWNGWTWKRWPQWDRTSLV